MVGSLQKSASSETSEVCPPIIEKILIFPGLSAGIEERDRLACQWVLAGGCAAFVFVAAPAGKTEILEGRRATFGLGDNVIKRHGLPSVRCRGVTVGTAPVIGGE